MKYRIMGYAWALEQAHFSYRDNGALQRALEEIAPELPEPGSDEFTEAWLDFRQGVKDSHHVIGDDDDTDPLTVSEIAERTGFNRSYIKAEITSGRLDANQPHKTGAYLINGSEFSRWYHASDHRGKRTN